MWHIFVWIEWLSIHSVHIFLSLQDEDTCLCIWFMQVPPASDIKTQEGEEGEGVLLPLH